MDHCLLVGHHEGECSWLALIAIEPQDGVDSNFLASLLAAPCSLWWHLKSRRVLSPLWSVESDAGEQTFVRMLPCPRPPIVVHCCCDGLLSTAVGCNFGPALTVHLALHHYLPLQHPNGSWYCFDDSYVSRVDDSQIETSAAYVLFYRRVPSGGGSNPASSSAAAGLAGKGKGLLDAIAAGEEEGGDGVSAASAVVHRVGPAVLPVPSLSRGMGSMDHDSDDA